MTAADFIVLYAIAAVVFSGALGLLHWLANRIPTAKWERKREARLRAN